MAAMAPFLVKSMVVVSDQRGEQVAVEIANDALERARGLDPSSLLTGRGRHAVEVQWAQAPAEVRKYQGTLGMAGDQMLPATSAAGEKAPLPTRPRTVTVNGTEYAQHWYVGPCHQPKADPAATAAAVGDCVAIVPPAVPAATDLPFLRVVVAVTWKQESCTDGACVYVASTLVSTGSDPRYDMKRPPPTVATPANQQGYVGVAAELQLAASGGWLPRTWSATGLPPGLTLAPSTGAITGTPTTAGTYTVTVKVTDRDKATDDATFTWTVAAKPALTSPGDQTTRTDTAVSLPITVTGGHQPMSWSATGLPGGLSINPATGVISGTSTAAQAQTQMRPVTVTVTDSGKQTTSVTFGWRVLTPMEVSGLPPTYSTTNGTNVGAVTPHGSGGLAPYTWQATGLPDGLSINPNTGTVTGTIQSGTRYITTITGTDSAGGSASATVVTTVTPSSGGDLRVTNPAPATADRSTALGVAVSLTATADPGAAQSHTWSATGLPPGVALAADTGVISGKPTARGTYLVKLSVERGSSEAHMMFIWRIT
jgi:hypothetical protein